MVIYLIVNTLNGKYYVGKTVQKLTDRWMKHLSDARKGSNTHLHNALRKYGTDKFTIHPLMARLTTDADLKK